MDVPKSVSIIFLSYAETNAKKNWDSLFARFPRAQRIHGVKGIWEAHQKAAQIAKTDFFFLVDGDNQILPDFDFKLPSSSLERDKLYVWRCLNPANGLIYGFGAIKLYNKSLLAAAPAKKWNDLATSVSTKYEIVDTLASATYFFETPEEAWRGAFRESFKLQKQYLNNPSDSLAKDRLLQWLDSNNKVPNIEWIRDGADQGAKCAKEKNGVNINDYAHLKTLFHERVTNRSLISRTF